MMKKCAFAVSALLFSAYAHAAAPNEDQVKQALYEHYATAQGAAQLQATLEKGVGVSGCEARSDEYRCMVENKALGNSIPMFFRFDAAQNKWVFVKEETN